jgi:hypothetical protein
LWHTGQIGDQDRKRWWALGLIVAAQFMVVLDVAIVNVALPSIRTDLDSRRRASSG